MKQVYTYALVKSLYDQGEDYIDCFWPFKGVEMLLEIQESKLMLDNFQ